MNIIFPVEDRSILGKLTAGDRVALSGIFYTARDAAHKRLISSIEQGNSIPNYLINSCIFYAGPAFSKRGNLTAIGPTTAKRMDVYAPVLYNKGVAATLGKGPRSTRVTEACKKYDSVYFMGYGGISAYLIDYVESIEAVKYEDLGPEAIYLVKLKDFPAAVGIDTCGKQITYGEQQW